jgi:hypothetical protein
VVLVAAVVNVAGGDGTALGLGSNISFAEKFYSWGDS